jgi:ribose/xylose/arabinose/galactoside ABC-type transport system permease subunit
MSDAAPRRLGRPGLIRAVKALYIYIVLVLIVAVFSVVKLGQVEFFGRGHFLSPDALINLMRMAVPIFTLSGAFTLLMIAGYIDLSVGSAMSLSAVLFALLVREGYGFAMALPLTLLMGMACGAVNGLLVVKLRITPVIATLVTLSLFKGIALLIVPDGLSAIKGSPDSPMPAWINYYARRGAFLGLPWAFYAAILTIAILVVVQKKTVLGKYAAAIGGNKVAAELSGINVARIAWILYIIVGVSAALAGVARASYMSLGDPLSGDGMETDCIIAVLLGGTAFSGGSGHVARSAVGALIIICVTTGLMTVIPAYWQNLAKGCVLIAAVVLNELLVKDKASA